VTSRPRSFLRLLPVIASALLFAPRPAAADTVIDQPPVDIQLDVSGGAGGQTFTAPADPYLTSFTFYGISGSGGASTLVIAAWDGESAGDPPLLTLPIGELTGSFQQVTVNTGGLELTPGSTYVAYVTNAAQATLSFSVFLNEGTDYPGGVAVHSAGNHWTPQGADLAFKATFSATPPDGDSDGVPDNVDAVPHSDTRHFADTGNGPTTVPNLANDQGITLQDVINGLAASAKNRGQYQSAIAQLANHLLRSRIISAQQSAELKRGAASKK
jgi:hypothetical protein